MSYTVSLGIKPKYHLSVTFLKRKMFSMTYLFTTHEISLITDIVKLYTLQRIQTLNINRSSLIIKLWSWFFYYFPIFMEIIKHSEAFAHLTEPEGSLSRNVMLVLLCLFLPLFIVQMLFLSVLMYALYSVSELISKGSIRSVINPPTLASCSLCNKNV